MPFLTDGFYCVAVYDIRKRFCSIAVDAVFATNPMPAAGDVDSDDSDSDSDEEAEGPTASPEGFITLAGLLFFLKVRLPLHGHSFGSKSVTSAH